MDSRLITSGGPLPRLLVAQETYSTLEPIVGIFWDNRLDVDFDLCVSYASATRKLFTSPYQLIISDIHLAEMDDFFLLKHVQTLEPFVPFIVTANTSEKASVRRVLERGAFDHIPTPLDHEQTVRSIRIALWHGKLKGLIARREKALERYRQHLADYPGEREKTEESFSRALLAVDKTISAVETTLLRFEDTMVYFSDFASNVESHTRQRALERLKCDDPKP